MKRHGQTQIQRGCCLCFALALFLGAPWKAAARWVFFVAPNGSDQSDGSRAHPFATLERARDIIRQRAGQTGLPKGGVEVYLRQGAYYWARSFELGKKDSGTEASPVKYAAYTNETVRIIGGRVVSHWKPLKDPAILKRLPAAARDHVWQVNLKKEGITDWGKMRRRGFGIADTPMPLELFFQDRPMTLARWPNRGWAKIAGTPKGRHGGEFAYAGDRPARWTNAPDIWVHGYWTWDWADSYEKVASIDVARHVIRTVPPHGVYGYKTGARWYALNLLEELDSPGEYYLDRGSGILYFWPPAPLNQGQTIVSMIKSPLVQMNGVSYLRLSRLTFECTRGMGIQIKNGDHVEVAGCTIRDIGTTGIEIHGRRNLVLSSDLTDIGGTGIGLDGGNRLTLEPGDNIVENCHLWRFSRVSRTYHPGIALQGVGNKILNNLMNDAPHSAILGGGNNHLIEFNEIHHVCQETSDAGAFYMGRDLTQRGNVVRYNYFHDLDRRPDVQSIYLDDCFCGTTVFGNIIYKGGDGVEVGGGRDNHIVNNIFIDCRPAIHVDARGKNWAKFWFNGKDPTLMKRLKAVHYNRPPYSTEYPNLKNILRDDPAEPKGNRIVRNICVGGRWLDLLNGLNSKIIEIKDNYVDGDPGFVSLQNRDFHLKKDSPVWKLGFQPIPIAKIGLYRDRYRTHLKTTGVANPSN